MDFEKVLTGSTVAAICPGVAPEILEAILTDASKNFARAGIDDEIKLAHFFGQIAAETGGLKRLDENLNYTTAERLQKVFGKGKFPTLAKATEYLKAPEKLANYVYANKNGNGGTNSGDGWTYRGSGLIQLTGRENFRNAGTLLELPLEGEPERARQPDDALAIALAYWTKRKISEVATEATDAAVEAVTKRINAAMHALAERKAYFKKAHKVFSQQTKSLHLMSALAARPTALSMHGDPVTPAMSTDSAAPPMTTEMAPLAPVLSGPAWVAQFPTSRSIDDLASGFAAAVSAFVGAMRAAGANVSISATYRPRERAYLMHWAWKIAKEGFSPALVPPMAGVDIKWVHSTTDKSKKAARDMVAAYGIVFKPALNSKHTERLAIDMTVSWTGSLAIKASGGNTVTITGSPRNGSNPKLQEIGRGYGAVKLPSDPPHWSDDGR